MHEHANVLQIGKRAFLNVFVILCSLMAVVGLLTYLVPAGAYQRDVNGSILFETYTNLGRQGYPIWRWFSAPIEVLFGPDSVYVIAISLFLLILGGSFNIMDKTGGILVMIRRLIHRYRHNKYTLLRRVVLFFMVFGAFFGIFEESIALMPIIILLSLSLGWDTMTGMGMCLLAAGFGFAAAVTNPFSIGIASTLAGVRVSDGLAYRMGIFIIIYVILTTFLVRYARKIEAEPTKSPTYALDLKKTRQFDLAKPLPYGNESRVFKAYKWLFGMLIATVLISAVLEQIIGLSVPTIPLMALVFLLGGWLCGRAICGSWRKTASYFLKGSLAVAPALILILLAVSVKHLMTEANLLDALLHALFQQVKDRSVWEGVLLLYGLVLAVQMFIGSSSAKAFLVMPLIVPLADLIGLTRETAVLAFVFGDGFTNLIFPTNGALLIGLSIASVSYVKWFRWTIMLQLLIFLLTVFLLFLAVLIGY
ncbi:MAG: YfcC family protein [Acholeplasmatales bacterium]|nr:MAG: YfcC family protein [Acholeplasmatales bacterium]